MVTKKDLAQFANPKNIKQIGRKQLFIVACQGNMDRIISYWTEIGQIDHNLKKIKLTDTYFSVTTQRHKSLIRKMFADYKFI